MTEAQILKSSKTFPNESATSRAVGRAITDHPALVEESGA